MNSITAFLSRLLRAEEWREIASAPFDREIELAVIGNDVGGSTVHACATATAGSMQGRYGP
jgi:hypothetical protein